MKLSKSEFDAMQMGWRKWYIREIELKTFRKFGLEIKGKDILEVGCGNGYAASLIPKAIRASTSCLNSWKLPDRRS